MAPLADNSFYHPSAPPSAKTRLRPGGRQRPQSAGRPAVASPRTQKRDPAEQGPVPGSGWPAADGDRLKVVAYDFGIKYNQLRSMYRRGCAIQVVPATTPAAEVLALEPDGVFLSNGPGDPAGVAGVVENVQALLGKRPIFGICLGHQMLGLAYGGTTSKLKFGHRGCNQPVKDLTTGKVEITSQNHGYCVDPATLSAEVEVTHINLNDGSLEGMRDRRFPVFSVQYHPEHAPGPHDAEYLFDRFVDLMRQDKKIR